jgi:hypothetical protein
MPPPSPLTHMQICNAAFPRQQRFRERASLLRYKHTVLLLHRFSPVEKDHQWPLNRIA